MIRKLGENGFALKIDDEMDIITGGKAYVFMLKIISEMARDILLHTGRQRIYTRLTFLYM